MESGMQFMTALLGGTQNTWLHSAFALAIVLVLIVLAAWALKIFSRSAATIGGRGRRRRLSVTDSIAVDGKRQLLIIRRDNVEHVILTGGPQDVVIESGIPAVEPVEPLPQPADIEAPVPPAARREAADRLRDLAQSDSPPHRSLRSTGLLRAVNRNDPEVFPIASDNTDEKAAGPAPDSATSGPDRGTGGTRLGVVAQRLGIIPSERG
jgi:hypothetical protein